MREGVLVDEQNINKRLDAHGSEIDRLTVCIEKLETIVKLQNEQMVAVQKDQENRIRAIENKSGEAWEKSVWAVIGAVIAGVVGFFLMQMGLK